MHLMMRFLLEDEQRFIQKAEIMPVKLNLKRVVKLNVWHNKRMLIKA